MFWKCPAIEVHPGRITSKGLFVQGPSDKFFADPAFARDEDGGIRLGHTLDHLHHPSHGCARDDGGQPENRKSTRLNSSHLVIAYAVFCLKKKKKKIDSR